MQVFIRIPLVNELTKPTKGVGVIDADDSVLDEDFRRKVADIP